MEIAALKVDGNKNELHGKVTFFYPDGSKIEGIAEEGDFISGAYYDHKGKKIKKLKVDFVKREEMPDFKHDKDPYEKRFLKVKEVEGKGQGLFAKRLIKQGQLCSLYSGTLIPHYKVDRRRWEFNSNTIEADPNFSIDVPSPYHKLEEYSASLGHKANHSFEPNSKYVFLFHPKFGDIMSVVATKDIESGEEITVNYGYSKHARGPKWYREARKAYRKEQKQIEIAERKRQREVSKPKAKTTSKRRKLE
mmetsp:Transcript_16948/g.16617  ORF Transcript_16948/g.16617 Transcript_16948/m.16617 type:complete len:249 (-) Transcript_16948:25-771(-)